MKITFTKWFSDNDEKSFRVGVFFNEKILFQNVCCFKLVREKTQNMIWEKTPSVCNTPFYGCMNIWFDRIFEFSSILWPFVDNIYIITEPSDGAISFEHFYEHHTTRLIVALLIHRKWIILSLDKNDFIDGHFGINIAKTAAHTECNVNRQVFNEMWHVKNIREWVHKW